jgi:hypothetical protein
MRLSRQTKHEDRAAFVLCSEFKHIISDHEMLLMQGFTGNAETKCVDK